MPLMNCPECGREVSVQASACPQCGYPIAGRPEASPPPVQQVHTHSTTQKVGSFEEGFGNAFGAGCGCLAFICMIVVGAIILLAMAAKR